MVHEDLNDEMRLWVHYNSRNILKEVSECRRVDQLKNHIFLPDLVVYGYYNYSN